MDILDTITAKLDRAREHLKTFDIAVREFYKSSPYAFTNEFKPKGQNIYDWVFYIHIKHEIPLRIRAIFGDGIQNIRATLDYLAYALGVLNVGINGDLDGVEFPIFMCKNKYAAVNKKGQPIKRSGLYKIRSINPKAQAIIEGLQPYHRGDNILLWHLQQLSIIDKHRHFHFVSPPFGDWFAWSPQGVVLSPDSFEGFIIRQRFFASPPLKNGAEIARFEVAVTPSFDFKVRVKHQLPVDVIVDEFGLSNAHAGKVMAGLIGFVNKKVIPQFKPFLG
jgi:hypothetical protein